MSEQYEARKGDLLAHIDRARADWEGILADAGKSELKRPGAMGDWSFRDVIAHLNGWRERTVLRLEAAHGGRAPAPLPWPAHLNGDAEEDVDAINDWFYERAKGRTDDDLIAESRAQLGRVRDLVAAIPAQDQFTPGRYSWLGQHALADVSFGSLEHLYEEHMPGIRAWLGETD